MVCLCAHPFVFVCAGWHNSMYTHKLSYSPASCSLLKWPPRSLHHMWTTLRPMPSTPQQHLSTTLMPLPQVSWDMATPTAMSLAQPPAPLRCTRPSPMRPLPPHPPSSSTHHSSTCNLNACSEGQASPSEHWGEKTHKDKNYCTVASGCVSGS